MSKATNTEKQDNIILAVPVSRLDKSPLNARKTVGKEACEELKASILAHGLMQNLVVTEGKKGRYLVVAGARRLAALQSLQAEGKLPRDHEVFCQLVDGEHALELSTAENTVRAAMHPADEFEAYARMNAEGKSAATIAERFGVDEKRVLKRLRLGKVAPALLEEYRAEKLTLECLMAFTVTDDQKRQLEVYESLDENEKNNGHAVRRALTETMVSATSGLATFVGIETYTGAGGHIRTDLFKESVYLESPDILRKLAAEKLADEAEKLKAEGWAWVHTTERCDHEFLNRCEQLEPEPLEAPQELLDQKASIEAELAAMEAEWEDIEDDDDDRIMAHREKVGEAEERLDEIKERLDSFAAYTPDQIAASGCYLYIAHDGELVIEKGMVKPEDKEGAENEEVTNSDEGDMEQPQPEKKGYSESLKRDLEAYRLAAAQAELAKHPALAFDLLVFKAAIGVFTSARAFDGPNVAFQKEHCGTASADARRFVSEQMEAVKSTLPLDWAKAKGEAEQFAAFQRLTDYQKQALLAFCVSATLQPKLADEGKPQTAYDIVLAQTGANVAEYWRPSATNFLSRIKSEQLLEIGDSIFGAGMWSSHRRNAKKAALVSELDRAFRDPENQICTEKLKNWLPAGVAFGQAALPQEAEKPKKGRKKAA